MINHFSSDACSRKSSSLSSMEVVSINSASEKAYFSYNVDQVKWSNRLASDDDDGCEKESINIYRPLYCPKKEVSNTHLN
ncbi:hypothetical protein SDJN03_09475, partial [Cucurbita argyrosperma subsp. sororia]